MLNNSIIYFLVLIFCLISPRSFSQVLLAGTVTSVESNETIPFVNIGIAGKSIGTVSGKIGHFELKLAEATQGDTLLFSCIGFESKSISVLDLQKEMINKGSIAILLSPKIFDLDEISIKGSELKSGRNLIAGNTKGRKMLKAGMGQGDMLGAELGTAIKNPGIIARIDKLYLSIAKNTYNSFTVRVNIYEYNGSEPGLSLSSHPIYVEIPKGKVGKMEIDLANYQIYAEGDFVLSLEYIQDMGEYGLYFSSSLGHAPSFIKKTSQDSWIKFAHNDKNVSLGIYTLLEVWD